jgi:hypothetical protein
VARTWPERPATRAAVRPAAHEVERRVLIEANSQVARVVRPSSRLKRADHGQVEHSRAHPVEADVIRPGYVPHVPLWRRLPFGPVVEVPVCVKHLQLEVAPLKVNRDCNALAEAIVQRPARSLRLLLALAGGSTGPWF